MKIFGIEITTEERGTPPPTDDFWYGPVMQPTTSGVNVTEYTALNFSAVFCAVNFISSTIAALPLITYIDTPSGEKERYTESDYYKLLHDRPHERMHKFQFWRLMITWMLLSGNAYAYKRTSSRKKIVELQPLHPHAVEIKTTDGGDVYYEFSPGSGKPKQRIPRKQMLHIAGFSTDGYSGTSIIQRARETIGLALVAEEHASGMYANGTRISGILKHPNRLQPETSKKLRESWERLYSGRANVGKTAILEEGLDFQQMGMTAEDAELLLSRRFQIEEIARWFDLPPHILKDLTHATYSNIEHLGLELRKYSLGQHTANIEGSLKRDIFDEHGEPDAYAEFLYDALERGDLSNRYRAYFTGVQGGWLSVNDIRRRENMPPVEGGDDYLQPLNMVKLGEQPQAVPAEDEIDAETDGGDLTRWMNQKPQFRDETKPQISFSEALLRFRMSYRRIFAEIARKLARREQKTLESYAKRDDFAQKVLEFYNGFDAILHENLGFVAESYTEQTAFIARNYHKIGQSHDINHERVALSAMNSWVAGYVSGAREAIKTQTLEQYMNVLAERDAEEVAEQLLRTIEQELLKQYETGVRVVVENNVPPPAINITQPEFKPEINIQQQAPAPVVVRKSTRVKRDPETGELTIETTKES